MTAQSLPEVAPGTLTVRHDGPTAWIVLDRPERRNALSPAMWAALPGLLHELDADPAVKVIGLRGAGGVFSAGADIGEVFDCLGEAGSGLPRGGLLTEAEAALAQVHKPTVAALEGFCMGGAWMLAGACDLRIAAASLRIGLTPARIGIVFPASGVRSLVRLVGPAVASALLLTGDTVPADRAEAWGMLTRVVADEQFEAALEEVVTGLAQRSQLSVQAHKHLVRLALAEDADDEADAFGRDPVSEALFREVRDGPDARIGQQAFLAKRRPRFTWTGEGFWAVHGPGRSRTGGGRAAELRARWQRQVAAVLRAQASRHE
ncbi:enoyl-CoA hydratase/isomerase family protein [Kocuria sp. LUK]|uniref:enoyl-CoA hydratase/isomerase family protein n=1 Tax=Kocuria sp. LUK TaxID=2897828 RepID=UPI001E390DF7|nr:enoyl-CoA hydratase/isomerase family protein [Kocuria sp. LUK]MCD1145172.1 enoyl-CoA hydratase/isomerase family protein [Kocuria sp. LUK]